MGPAASANLRLHAIQGSRNGRMRFPFLDEDDNGSLPGVIRGADADTQHGTIGD